MEKILIIEDNDEINNLLREMLSGAGYEIKQAFSGSEGNFYFSQEQFDLVILDLMLPGMSGEEVLKEIRSKSQAPVIIISAKTDIDGKVDLLSSGADDYITKPFDLREVLARIQLQLKKKTAMHESSRLTYEELTLDITNFQMYVNDNPVALTKHEFSIMEMLLKHPEKIYSKQELYELAWDDFYIGEDKTLNVHISNIRKKIKSFTDREYIDTVWGIGFRLKK